MKEKTVKKIFITEIVIFVLLYSLILYSISHDIGYDDGYYNGAIDTFITMDSLYIIIPKDTEPIIPKKQPYKKFEDDKFVKNHLSIKNNAYSP